MFICIYTYIYVTQIYAKNTLTMHPEVIYYKLLHSDSECNLKSSCQLCTTNVRDDLSLFHMYILRRGARRVCTFKVSLTTTLTTHKVIRYKGS